MGCKAVYQALHEAGFAHFYRYAALQAEGPQAASVAPSVEEFTPQVWASHSTALEGGLCSTVMHLEGVHCAGCIWLIEQMPRGVAGVKMARLDFGRGQVEVQWDREGMEDPNQMLRWLGRFGYRATPLGAQADAAASSSGQRAMVRRVGWTWAMAGNVMLWSVAHYAGLTPLEHPGLYAASVWVMVALTTMSLAYGADVILRRAWHGLWHSVRSGAKVPLPVDVPLALGIGIGWAASVAAAWSAQGELWLDSVAMLIAAVVTARWLQQRAGDMARSRTRQLLSMWPKMARRIAAGGERERVSLRDLVPGDLVEVMGGEQVPVDGRIVWGSAEVNRSAMTGEFRPEQMGLGAEVCAGATLESGCVHIQVEKVGDQTKLGELIAWVSERQSGKAEALDLANTLGGAFVLVVIVAAGVLGFIWHGIDPSRWVSVVVSALVITCPCALGMATPLALALASAQAAKRGVFIKHDGTMGRCEAAEVVVFDKTGTLTKGTPQVVETWGEANLLEAARHLEATSLHPVAQAIAAGRSGHGERAVSVFGEQVGSGLRGEVEGRGIAVGRPEWVGEQLGVSATGEVSVALEQMRHRGLSVVLVATEDAQWGVFGLGDAVREEAGGVVAWLKGEGKEVRLLSGDHQEAVGKVADALGIEHALGDQRPEDKAALVSAWQAAGQRVVMVGDGINDAKALTQADVGVTVAGGAHISMAAADVFLTHDSLRCVQDLFCHARHTHRTLKLLIAYALAYNVCGLVLAGSGAVTPLIAAVLMPLSSLFLLALTWWYGAGRGPNKKEAT